MKPETTNLFLIEIRVEPLDDDKDLSKLMAAIKSFDTIVLLFIIYIGLYYTLHIETLLL
jgi:hypothetical protein